MICCTVVSGLVCLLIGLLFLKNKKKQSKNAARSKALKDQANSWIETEITEFDPRTKITQECHDEMIDRLKKRIVCANLHNPDSSPYGTPATFVNLIADYLINEFDFGSINETLSKFNHFKTVIGDVNLHFVHMVGSEEKRSTPIILLNGWPSTIWEFHKSIPLLVEQGYTVVCPSLPGHGFTEPPTKPGVSPAVIACVYHKLMIKLGYKKYVVHGGNWGAMIGSMITYIYPDHITGLHITIHQKMINWRTVVQSLVGTVFPSLVYTTEQERRFIHPVSEFSTRMYKQFAYFHAQSVMPDSYGYGMVDSPTGLIGWIGAVYPIVSASRKDTEPMMTNLKEGLINFGINNVCANLSIFWATRSAQASMRIYYEFHWNDYELFRNLYIPSIPVAISNFPYAVFNISKFVSKSTYNNIQQFTYHSKGGLFPLIDNTEAALEDMISFINNIN